VSDEVVENESVASENDATEAFDARSEAERQRDEYIEALQRLQAEFENYRKRVQRNADDAGARAAGDIVAKLLPVIDAFDYAQAHFEGSSDEAAALGQARSLMLDTLKREGLERVDGVGVDFDPQVHDAVAHAPNEEGEEGQVVVEVLRAGYRWKGVILRPAMVKVRG
jgi:molecular chaperone GrpE